MYRHCQGNYLFSTYYGEYLTHILIETNIHKNKTGVKCCKIAALF